MASVTWLTLFTSLFGRKQAKLTGKSKFLYKQRYQFFSCFDIFERRCIFRIFRKISAPQHLTCYFPFLLVQFLNLVFYFQTFHFITISKSRRKKILNWKQFCTVYFYHLSNFIVFVDFFFLAIYFSWEIHQPDVQRKLGSN